MPTYVYARKSSKKKWPECEVCSGQFETVQKMAEDALTQCPKCGAPIERVILAPHVANPGGFKKPSDDRLAKAGFTQYKRKGKGYYEKSFGGGPSAIHPGSDS